MNKLGLLAFGVTTCVLVPTTLHLLQAGPQQVAKLTAVDNQTIVIDGAKIEVKVDKGIVDPGQKVHVTLTATADTRTRARVGVLVLESTGTGGGRVELPPDRVGRDEVVLDTRTEGTATKTFAFTLAGNRAQEMEGQAQFGHYTILVMKPEAIDKLEKLRRRAEGVQNPMEDYKVIGDFETVYRQLGSQSEDDATQPVATPTEVARLDINTRPSDSPVSISVADSMKVDDDLAVTVKVKNPTKTAIESVKVSLSPTPSLSATYKGLPEDNVAITIDDGKDVISLGPNETKSVVFHVKANATGVLGLFAQAECTNGDCYSNGVSAINDGALDAVDVLPKDEPTSQPVAVSL
jgi:hypothetical protein